MATKAKPRRSKSKPKAKKLSKVKISIEKPGSLSEQGYKLRSKTEDRRKALKKAIGVLVREKNIEKREAAVLVKKKLVVLKTFHSKKVKSLGEIAERDAKWVTKQYLGAPSVPK